MSKTGEVKEKKRGILYFLWHNEPEVSEKDVLAELEENEEFTKSLKEIEKMEEFYGNTVKFEESLSKKPKKPKTKMTKEQLENKKIKQNPQRTRNDEERER